MYPNTTSSPPIHHAQLGIFCSKRTSNPGRLRRTGDVMRRLCGFLCWFVRTICAV